MEATTFAWNTRTLEGQNRSYPIAGKRERNLQHRSPRFQADWP